MSVGLAAGIANGVLDALCRSVTFSDPAAFYIQLHTGDPGAAGTSNVATENTRKVTTFAAASAGVSATSGDVVWTNVAGTETISYISFWSAVTTGTFIGSDVVDVPRAVTAGDNLTLAAGDGQLTLGAIAA